MFKKQFPRSRKQTQATVDNIKATQSSAQVHALLRCPDSHVAAHHSTKNWRRVPVDHVSINMSGSGKATKGQTTHIDIIETSPFSSIFTVHVFTVETMIVDMEQSPCCLGTWLKESSFFVGPWAFFNLQKGRLHLGSGRNMRPTAGPAVGSKHGGGRPFWSASHWLGD